MLDVGTGVGGAGRYLKARGFVVEGITLLRKRRRDGQRTVMTALRSLILSVLPSSCFSDGTFDVIVCADILEHLRNAPVVLSDLRGLLSPARAIACFDPERDLYGGPVRIARGRFQRT